jgi:hypothetical protein
LGGSAGVARDPHLNNEGKVMTGVKATNLGLLLRCYEGLRNWRALVMLAAGFVVFALLLALDGMVTVKLQFSSPTIAMIIGAVILLLAVLALLASINGSGLLLVDQADGTAPRGFGAAVFGGIGVTLQAIACLIILGVGFLLVVLVLWALSFLAHIPGVGGFFGFILAGPTMLILAFCYAVLAFGVALMFVALWRGHGMLGSIGRAIDIVIKRPLDTVLHFIVLWLLIVPIMVFVEAVMFGGTMLTMGMYASSSFGGGGYYGGGPFGGGGLMGGVLQSFAGGSMGAATISIAIVFAAVVALFALIQILGTILIFDSLAADTEASSADFLRRRAQNIKAEVEKHRPQTAPAAPQPAPASAAHCTQCGAALTPGDKFCGECGTPVG